jgi:hypothetical protein
MAIQLRRCLLVLIFFGLTDLADAQIPKAKITGARVGFSGIQGSKQYRFKTGQWAPLYIDVDVGLEQIGSKDYEIVVETTDNDDMQNYFYERRFLPTLEKQTSYMLLAYVRTGLENSEITVSLRSLSSRGENLSTRKVDSLNYESLSPSTYHYLALGGPLSGLRRALTLSSTMPLKPGQVPEEGGMEVEGPETQQRRVSYIDSVELMPTSWFGYQSADTVLLATGSKNFVEQLNLANDDRATARLMALKEWVQRGGQLVVAVGHNHDLVGQVLTRMEIIDLTVKGLVPQVKRLPGVEKWADQTHEPFRGRPSPTNPGEISSMEVANLVPGAGVKVLAYDQREEGAKGAYPVIVQASCGRGRILVLAFDVDQPPFTFWKGQAKFWNTLRQNLEPPGIDNLKSTPNYGFRGYGYQSNELASRLQESLEAFPDVPVISFGWVALFILVYILIVGPLDYFFLKKVIKRLELTWITFPTVVILISTIAYFAAYYLKGNDLRINKVDVVDIDLQQPHAYGTTWFTLFSPRIQNYTVGVEPNTPTWGKETSGDRTSFSPLVGWMGRPESGPRGMHGGSPGLFRRAYDYAPEASGLLGVPIQVWSTKSFTASWHRPLAGRELFEAELEFTRTQDKKVGGWITSHLPVELHDVVLFYRGRAYNMGRLTPEVRNRIDDKEVGAKAGDLDLHTWFQQGFIRPKAFQATPSSKYSQTGFSGPSNQPLNSPGLVIKPILFFGHPSDSTPGTNQPRQNSMLRDLDQRWRLDPDNRQEVVLFGRAMPAVGQNSEGPAEDMTQSGLSPSRLWLGKLPGEPNRPALIGTLFQETYVRVFIPVK